MTTTIDAALCIAMPVLNEGETYAGLVLNDEGKPSHHLILMPGDNNGAAWDTQMAWAKEQGGELPTRQEQALLYANCKKHFKADWYWSCEQHASDAEYAWFQYFHDGLQTSLNRYGKLRARAVRRLPIQ